MRLSIVLLVSIVMWLGVVACEGISKDAEVETAAQSKGFTGASAYERYPTQHTLMYIHDPRTNECFAYVWGGGSYGGPALATVDCGVVHDYLIDIPK